MGREGQKKSEKDKTEHVYRTFPGFYFYFKFLFVFDLSARPSTNPAARCPLPPWACALGGLKEQILCTYDKFSTFPIQFDHLSTSCTVLLSSPLLLSSLSAALLSAREEEEEEDDKRSLLSLGSSLTLYTAS